MRQPPGLAVLMVSRLAPFHESIDGDLLEDFQRGRSSLWYWRQAVWTILWTVSMELRRDPLQAVRMICTGMGLTGLLRWLFWKLWFAGISRPVFEFVSIDVWSQ